jgi:hypothetical protein
MAAANGMMKLSTCITAPERAACNIDSLAGLD